MNKILFYAPFPLTKKLGAARVIIELGAELQNIGWSCTYIETKDIVSPESEFKKIAGRDWLAAPWLRDYLVKHAHEYDVVDYDHRCLPYPRATFDARPLFVARSQLLCHNLETIQMPIKAGFRSWLGNLLLGRRRRSENRHRISIAWQTLQESDLITLSNNYERKELLKLGIPEAKIAVFPNGVDAERRPLFDEIPVAPPDANRVAFVGTFDPRKGAREFPEIVRLISKRVSSATFRLLGTGGMYPTADAVRADFPATQRARLEIEPRFEPAQLPQKLADCSIGIYPSYMEGCPLGVLEMLAAGLPVVAYDAPGLDMLLPADYLVPSGDYRALADKAVGLLSNRPRLADARIWARKRAHEFRWDEIAVRVSETYLAHLAKLRRQTETKAG